MKDTRELAWAAGLFEGEGCFHITGKSAQANLHMTDEDTVRRFAAAIGIGNVHDRPTRHDRKPSWVWRVGGLVKVQAVVAMLWFGLGARRRQRAKEILAIARHVRIMPADRTHCPKGHPYDEANTRWAKTKWGEQRICRACNREVGRASRARREARALKKLGQAHFDKVMTNVV